jgi:plastocyanin
MRLKLVVTSALTSIVLGSLVVTTALASSPGSQSVRIQDRCDPVTFKAAGVPCFPHERGTVKFQDLFAIVGKDPQQALRNREAAGWRFNSDDLSVKRGTRLELKNEGGELHTFTRLPAFGSGCVPPVNALFGFDMNPICDDATVFDRTGVLPGGTRSVTLYNAGTYYFQCLIHPWMRTTVHVSAN